MESKHLFFLRITGYASRREVRMVPQDQLVFIEVAEENHCHICQSRISHFEKVQREKDTKIVFERLYDRHPPQKTLWAGVNLPETPGGKELTDEELKEFLRETFDLPNMAII